MDSTKGEKNKTEYWEKRLKDAAKLGLLLI